MSNLASNQQLVKNYSISILSLIVNLGIGLWIVPYLVKHLGVTAYGFVPLALLFTEYINFIIQSINTSFGRYLILSLQQKEVNRANQFYSTTFFILFIFIIIQFLMMLYIINNISSIISIPKVLHEDVKWIFLLTAISFSFSLLRAFFATTLYAYNRIDLIKHLDIINQLLRVFAIVTFFSLSTPLLKYIGFANIAGALGALLLSIYYSSKISKDIDLSFKYFDKTKIKELSNTSIWVLLNQVGMILFLKLDLLLTNKLVGTFEAGQLAIVSQLQILLKQILEVLTASLWPILMIYYANNEKIKLIKSIIFSTKVYSILLGIIVGIICGSSEELLKLWLGKYSHDLNILLITLLAPLVLISATNSSNVVQFASNKLQYPVIFLLILGTLKILISIILVDSNNSLGIYNIIIPSLFTIIVYNVIYVPMYAARLLKTSYFSFIYPIKYGFLTFFVMYLFIYLLTNFLFISSLPSLFILYAFTSIVGLIITFYIFLTSDEQRILIDFLPPFIKTKFKFNKESNE